MTLILPKPDPDLLPSGPTDWENHPGGLGLPDFRDSSDLGAPAIGYAMTDIRPDETMTIFGDGLASADFVVWSEGLVQEITTPLRQAADRAQITIPLTATGIDDSLTRAVNRSMMLVWPKAFSGYGRPIRINAPELHWVYPGKKWTALEDRTIEIFGRCLSIPNYWGMVVAQKGTDDPVRLRIVSRTDNSVKAELPAGYAAGSYQVWVHNGSGGEYGWSEAGTFTVAANTYTYATAVTVDSQAGATDQDKIEAAITAAGANGTVTFASRAYTVTAQINVTTAVKLVGGGIGETTLTAATEKYIWLTGAGAIVQDMTLSGLVIASRNIDQTIQRVNSSVKFQEGCVTSYASSAATQTQNQAVNLEILDSTFKFEGCGMNLYHTGYHIKNCEFYGNYQGDVYTTIGGSSATGESTNVNAIKTFNAHKMLVEDCYASSYDAENDIHLNRFWLANWSCDTNVVFRNNVIERCGAFGETADAQTNSGEAFCMHGNLGGVIDTVVSATDTTVVVDGTAIVGEDLGSNATHAVNEDVLYAVVLSGIGKGQVRLIDAASETTDTTLTVSKWRIQPEAGDKIGVRPLYKNILITGNYVDSVPDERAVIFGRTGVTFWMASAGVIVTDNTFKHCHEGVRINCDNGTPWYHGDSITRGNTFESMYGTLPYPFYPKAFSEVTLGNIEAMGVLYSWGNAFRGNDASDCEVGAYVGACDYDRTTTVNFGRDDTGYTAAITVGLMGTVIENNTITDNSTDKALIYGPTANWTLFRGNTVDAGQDVTGFNTGKTTAVLDEQ